MKTTKAFSIDMEIFKRFQDMVGIGAVSSKLEDFMRDYTETDGTEKGLSKQIRKKKIEILNETHDEVLTELTKLRAIDKAEQEADKIKDLQKLEEKKILSEIPILKCLICTSETAFFYYPCEKGYLCHECTRNADPQDLEKYGEIRKYEVITVKQYREKMGIKRHSTGEGVVIE